MLGSPPRMRGKLISTVLQGITQRITPADAGKTRLLTKLQNNRWDHPRGCGENGTVAPIAIAITGITPADAGKTDWR